MHNKKIFIDCGAWEGTSIQFFIDNYPNFNEFEIYAFECNKRLIPKLRTTPATIIESAVWTHDGEIELFIGEGKYTESSSLIKEKKTGNLNKDKPDKVPCIDFSKWILNNFNKDNFIIVKMNIEGAEYEVIKKMHKDGSLPMINIFYMQWHYNKINMSEKEHNKIVSLIDSNTIVRPWYYDRREEFKI